MSTIIVVALWIFFGLVGCQMHINETGRLTLFQALFFLSQGPIIPFVLILTAIKWLFVKGSKVVIYKK